MTSFRIRALRRWAFPVALCAVVTVGCSTVGGAATGGATSPPVPSAPSSFGAPSTLPEQSDPGGATSDAPVSTPDAGTPQPPTSPGGSATPVDPSSPAASTAPVLELDRFQSPTRNIGCLVDRGTYVRCDLGTSAITEKHDCKDVGDWGQAVALTAGRPASMICASDTVKDAAAPVLPYGSSTKVGSITCTSREDGMHCGDGAGHGFWLSRSSYAVS